MDYHLEINSAVSDKGFVTQPRRSGEIARIQAQLSNSLESLNKTKGSVIKVGDFDSGTCVRCLQDGADVFILCGTGESGIISKKPPIGWMCALNDTVIGGRDLRSLVLPYSHDAGMSKL